MGRRHNFWIPLLVLLLLSSGCDVAVFLEGGGQLPVGTYDSNLGAGSDRLKLTGRDYVFVSGGAIVIEGSYSTSGDQISLTTSDRSDQCRLALGVATYTYKWDGTRVQFDKVDDSCSYRARLMQQSWVKH